MYYWRESGNWPERLPHKSFSLLSLSGMERIVPFPYIGGTGKESSDIRKGCPLLAIADLQEPYDMY